MRESDFDQFGAMLDTVCSLLSKGSYAPSPTNTAMFFRALVHYDLAAVRKAFDAHVADPVRGRFVPVPADLIAQIQGRAADDKRPGADEAWSIALGAADEAKTIVWTDEVAQAWQAARVVLDGGDKVGARMAFRDTYERLVAEARKAGKPVTWSASLGQNPAERDEALMLAHAAGLLPAPEKLVQLPAPDHALSPTNASMPPTVREGLRALRDKLAAKAAQPGGPQQAYGGSNGWFTPVDQRFLPPGMRPDGAERPA